MVFWEEQGYNIEENVIYQDNKSAIRMEKNGRNLFTGNSLHINIQYLFVKDVFDKNEVRIEHFPTEWMLVEFFTKSLQGELFRQFRDIIMG